MLDDFFVTCREFVVCVEGSSQQRFVVKPSEQKTRFDVAGIHPYSHPLALACQLILELDLDVTTGLERWYIAISYRFL